MRSDIRSAIEATATYEVAFNVLQREQEVRQQFLKECSNKNLKESVELESLIKEELLKKYKVDLLAKLQNSKKKMSLLFLF